MGGDDHFAPRRHPLRFSVSHHSKCHAVCRMDLLSTQTGNDIYLLKELDLAVVDINTCLGPLWHHGEITITPATRLKQTTVFWHLPGPQG